MATETGYDSANWQRVSFTAHGPHDDDADEPNGPDTLPTSPDKQEEPLDDAPPASVLA